eukprot:GFUD01028227.1.p1 GENE.GFUD01028227.1~~GFUD01028227.1.p1  ORF type:complete len:553 (+),score=129.57 GFUD01028227.1:75-1733(+)
MPARKNVPSLVNLTSTNLSNLVLSSFNLTSQAAVTEWAKSLYELLAGHLQCGVYQELVQMLLIKMDLDFANNSSLRPKVRQFVPYLLGPHIKSLDFTNLRVIADKSIMKSIYAKFDEMCPNLERLSMGQSFFFMPEMVSNLNLKLEKFTKLMSLKIMYIATDIMLIDIGKLCPKIVELSLKGSNKIEDGSADSISTCRNLMILDIQGTKISGKGCLSIIESCPKLEWIEHCPFNCDSDFQIFRSRKEMFALIQKGYQELQANQAARENSPNSDIITTVEPYNIKNFWLFNPKSEELVVSMLCPKLEKIRLDFVFQDMDFALDASTLVNFKHLHTLDLNFYDRQQNSLLDHILGICGEKLSTLIYNVCADYRSVVDCHNIIAKKCPNLTSLTFIGDYENAAHLDQESDSILLRRTSDFQPHPKLEDLTLGGYCTDGRLAWLVSGSPRIKNISLDGNLERLSDSSWFAILTENSLEHLETLWLNTSTNMSMESIKRLLEECPKMRRVGRLIHLREHAGGARRDNLLQLLEGGKQMNWDVDFVWVTPNKQISLST